MAKFISVYVDDIEEYKALHERSNNLSSNIDGIYDLSETLSGQSYINPQYISLIILDNSKFAEKSITITTNAAKIELIFGDDEEDEYDRLLKELGVQVEDAYDDDDVDTDDLFDDDDDF